MAFDLAWMKMPLVVIPLMVCLCTSVTTASKILLLPFDHHSHVTMFLSAGKALREAGHDVWILTSMTHANTTAEFDIHPILVNASQKANAYSSVHKQTQQALSGKQNMIDIFFNMVGALSQFCKETLRSKPVMKQLLEKRFDLALVDGVPFYRCIYLVPHYLSIPYMTLTSMPDPWNAGVSAMPSLEPLMVLSYSNQMWFWQRIINTCALWFVTYIFPPSFMMPDNMATHYVPQKPAVSLHELYRRSEMWLVNFEPNCFDYHRVSAPNYRYIGGVNAEAAKPLPPELADFVDKAPHGVVVMTFGSLPSMARMPATMISKFLRAFGKSKQRFVVKQEHPRINAKNIPANVRMFKWLPQNDLLGHPKTRVFITHGGTNGQLEALYHGVPMLVMPVLGDQFYSAGRVEFKQFGKTLPLQTFTTEQLREALRELVNNATYRDAIRKCSAIVRQLPSPQESIVFWVNHILQFGGSHLRSPALDMPMWKFLMLDVVAFLLIIVILLCIMTICCCRLAWKCAKHVRPFPTIKQKTE